MNTKVTMITVIVAAALGLVLLFTLTRNPAQPTDTRNEVDRTNLRLLDPESFDPENVTAISIEWVDGESATFEKQNDAWHQTAPHQFLMKTFSIRRLATAAADLNVLRTIKTSEFEGDLTLAKLELDPPAAVITYTLESSGNAESTDTSTVTVQLGQIFVGGNAYARLDVSGPVYVVHDDLHTPVLQGDPSDWRENRIFTSLGAEVSRIRYEDTEAGTTVALRRVDNSWSLVEPIDARGDDAAVRALVQTLIDARLRGWVDAGDPNDAVYGVVDPAMSITVETDRVSESGEVETESSTLQLGNQISLQDQSRYAALAGASYLFSVDRGTIERLMPEYITLVSKSAADVQPENAGALAVTSPAGVFRLERASEGGWIVNPDWEDATYPAREAIVDTLLHRLTMEQANVDEGTLAEEDAVATVTLHAFDDSPISTVRFGATDVDGEFRVVFDSGTGVIRYTPDVELPAYDAQAYILDESEEDEQAIAVPVDPDSVSK